MHASTWLRQGLDATAWGVQCGLPPLTARPPRPTAAKGSPRGSCTHCLDMHRVRDTQCPADTRTQTGVDQQPHTLRQRRRYIQRQRQAQTHSRRCSHKHRRAHPDTKTNKCPEVLLRTDVEAHAHLGCLLDLPAWGHGNLAPVAPGRTLRNLLLCQSPPPWAPVQPPPLALGLGPRPWQPRP